MNNCIPSLQGIYGAQQRSDISSMSTEPDNRSSLIREPKAHPLKSTGRGAFQMEVYKSAQFNVFKTVSSRPQQKVDYESEVLEPKSILCQYCFKGYFQGEENEHLKECTDEPEELKCPSCQDKIVAKFYSEHLKVCRSAQFQSSRLIECFVCSVYLTEYEAIRSLACAHTIHLHCLNNLLAKNITKCPICDTAIQFDQD